MEGIQLKDLLNGKAPAAATEAVIRGDAGVSKLLQNAVIDDR